MKKKFLGVISVTLVTSMLAASLSGCGTQAKATDQEIAGEETIIVTDDDFSEDVAGSTEDEITETEEVIVGNEVDIEASVTEHEYFYALDKQDLDTEENLDMNALEPDGNDFEINNSVTLYGSGRAVVIGYTKPNIRIHVISSNEEWYCIYFADEDPEYQLVLVKAEEFIAATGIEIEEKILTTLDDVKKTFMDSLSEIQYQDDTVVSFEMLDSVSADMEFVEFKVPMYCNESDTRQLYRWISQMQVENQLATYSKFYIESIEDEFDDEYLWFKVYYKDLQ